MDPLDIIAPIASLIASSIIAIISSYYHRKTYEFSRRTYELSLKERKRAYFVELIQKQVSPIRDEIRKRIEVTRDEFLLDVMNRSSRNLNLEIRMHDTPLHYELENSFITELEKDGLKKEFDDYLSRYNGLMEESERFQEEYKTLMIRIFKSSEVVQKNMDTGWDYSRDLYPQWLDSQANRMARGLWKKLNDKAGNAYLEVTKEKEGVKHANELEVLIGEKYVSCMECLENLNSIVDKLRNRIKEENNLTASESISQENINWGYPSIR